MAHDPNPPLIDPFVADLVRVKALQLVGKAGFTRSDIEDIQHDLLLHYWRKRHHYDSSRGRPEAFFRAVIDRAVADLIRLRRAAKRKSRPHSLQSPVRLDEGLTTLAELIAARHDDLEHAALAADLALVLARLPARQRRLAVRLCSQLLAEAARDLGVPRTSLYREVLELRRAFCRAGLDGYLQRRSSPRERFT